MSVLACSRQDCDGIMCEYFSYEYGYLCSDCFNELVASGPETNIKSFLRSPKKPESNENEALARFSAVFKKREIYGTPR